MKRQCERMEESNMMIPQEFQKYVLIGMAVLAVACILLGIFLILQIRKRKLEAKKAESAMESMKTEYYNKVNSTTKSYEERVFELKRQNSYLQSDCRMKIDTAKKQCADEIQAMRERCESEIQAMQKRCKNDMQALKEKIETDKQELQAKPEKELLVDILYAMGGYGDRISRLETVLQHEKILKSLDALSEEVRGRMDAMAEGMRGKIETLSTALMEKMNDLADGDTIYSMSSCIDEIKDEVSTIQYDIGSLRSSVEDRSEADGVGDKIESLFSEVSSMRWDIDSIKSACEEAKSAAEEAKSAAEDVKYAIESKDF